MRVGLRCSAMAFGSPPDPGAVAERRVGRRTASAERRARLLYHAAARVDAQLAAQPERLVLARGDLRRRRGPLRLAVDEPVVQGSARPTLSSSQPPPLLQ